MPPPFSVCGVCVCVCVGGGGGGGGAYSITAVRPSILSVLYVTQMVSV